MLSKFRAEELCRLNNYNWADNGTSRMRELCRGKKLLIRGIKNERKIIMGWIYQPGNEHRPPEIKTEPRQDALFDYQGSFLRR